MPSPFPGMDPYLEDQVWPEFRNNLISEIQAVLVPHLRPRYIARIEERVYLEHEPDGEVRPVRVPDMLVLSTGSTQRARGGSAVATAAEPVRVPIRMPEEVREAYLEIRRRESGDLVTVLEVLSKANKRPGSDGLREYLKKRDQVLGSAVHLVELDLLRGGQRLPMAGALPPGDYYAITSRSEQRPIADVWAFSLRDRMPAIRIPLTEQDADLYLDLQAAFDAVYDRTGYDYSLDYGHGTTPPLSPEDQEWANELPPARS